MKSLSLSSTLLFGLVVSHASGQSTTTTSTTTSTTPDPNSDFYQVPSKLINFPGCFQDLVTADRDGDGFVKSNEYLGFIQEYAQNRKCITNPELTLQQRIAFNTIACGCRSEQGSSSTCCIGNNAEIRTAGALDPKRTASQNSYLTSACRVTDATLGPSQCPPVDNVRDPDAIPPLPALYASPPVPRPPESGDDGPPNWIWAIIAAALLLLLCCCCVFVWRKKKPKEVENEEEEIIVGKGAPGSADEAGPEQAASVPPVEEEIPVVPPVAVPRGGDDDEDEDEEAARKRSGGGPLGEEDEEDGRKRYGAPRLPPPEPEDSSHKLRPPPPKEPEEEPEWDHPGRPIEYPKEKDEMDPGQVDHYEPDGGVYFPERPGKDPIEMDPQWERGMPEDPDERDKRQHRIQSGFGEGEVWDQLDKNDPEATNTNTGGGDVFDWVVQSALGILDENDAAAHNALDSDGDERVNL